MQEIYKDAYPPKFILCHLSQVDLPQLRLDSQTSFKRAVVVAQLVERSLPVPDVRGSNPVIGKN